ncbi:acyltransferase family protein [Patulibacter defluvii]|uniref:acyltransferase family protein n=1 Tax=Patulibacter defluvii TaxID=3095358 RepID=UPI002A75335A|nr:acyltransferase [Patulibacter sp. DM4]
MASAATADATPARPATDPAAARAQQAAARKRKASRLQELDALRALMFLVVVFHALQASRGDVSLNALRTFSTPGIVLGNIDVLLPTFFLLSGFALYYQLLGAIMLGRPLPRGASFLFKRAIRLIPVYAIVFLVVWFWRFGGGSAQWMDLLWGMSLMQSWSTDHIFRTIDPGWYLSVEWQFAVVTAIAILPWLRMVSRWPLRSRLVGALVPPLTLIAITIWWKKSLVSHGVPGNHWGSWFAPPSWALLYGVGMLLGMALILRPPDRWRLPRPLPLMLFLAGTSWLLWLETMRGVSRFTTQWYFELGMLGSLCWILATITADPDGAVRRTMRKPFVQLLAAASFSTYLVHAPVLRSLNARDVLPLDAPAIWPYSTLAIMIIALILGVLAFRYVEMPLASLDRLLRPKLDHDTQVTRTFAASLAAGTALPPVEVVDGAGRPLALPALAAERPLLLLLHPADPVPRGVPALQGVRGALRALDGARIAAAGLGVGLATLAPRLPPDEGGAAEADQVVRLRDPQAVAARALGALVVRTAAGDQQPEIVLLAVARGGEVLDVIRDEDPHRMLRRGLERFAPGAAAATPAPAPLPAT